MKMLTPLFLALILLSGCVGMRDKIVVGTSTLLGFEIAQNPASQLYQVKFGYARAEMALVPTNGVDVLTELHFNNLTGTGGLYQRLAVGENAVKASSYLFAKDASGYLPPETARAISQAVESIPPVNSSGTAAKIPLAEAYRLSLDKAKFDVAAQTVGYLSFQAFLLNTALTHEQVLLMQQQLKTAGLFLTP